MGGERGEDLAGTGDEAVELEGEECSRASATACSLRETDASEKTNHGIPADVRSHTAVVRQHFHGIGKRDRSLTFQLLPILESDGQFGPDGERMITKFFVSQGFRKIFR